MAYRDRDNHKVYALTWDAFMIKAAGTVARKSSKRVFWQEVNNGRVESEGILIGGQGNELIEKMAIVHD